MRKRDPHAGENFISRPAAVTGGEHHGITGQWLWFKKDRPVIAVGDEWNAVGNNVSEPLAGHIPSRESADRTVVDGIGQLSLKIKKT